MKGFIKKSLIFALGMSAVASAQSFCNDTHSGEKITTKQNKVGFIGDVGYELWGEQGDQSATFYSDGSMICNFNGNKDYLCRTGKSYDSDKTYKELGHLYADFSVKMSNRKDIEYSYIGIYGWTRSPLVEWYIVDSWGTDWRPGDWVGETKIGRMTIDGAEYDVYKNHRKSYSIDGDNMDFDQYFSVRVNKRDCGTIDITAHFDAWESKGLTMGLMHEAKVLGEAGNSSGPKATGVFDFVVARVYTPEDLAPASSSSEVPVSSSSFNPGEIVVETPTDSTVTDIDITIPDPMHPVDIDSSKKFGELEAIAPVLKFVDGPQTYSVFDMQGKFLGKVESSVSDLRNVLLDKFGLAGVYIVRNKNFSKQISTK